MKVKGKQYRTIWMGGNSVFFIEQNLLPFKFEIFESTSYQETCQAIREMKVRGAGAIGTAAGYALAQAFLQAPENDFWEFMSKARTEIESNRPTARNLFYAVNKVFEAAVDKLQPNSVITGKPLLKTELQLIRKIAVKTAQEIADKDADDSRKIGEFGNDLIQDGYRILTHCNAGWLAFTDFGTALSPIYRAHQSGKKIFVFVDETRPRNQGARLTAWELQNENIPHKIIPDNAAAHLMQLNMIDLIIVGADRVAANGDVANKIGTLEKAICAQEYNIPFYVAAPISTFDPNCLSGNEIIIEERSPDEVLYQSGINETGEIQKILVCAPGSGAYNPAFDVTPAKYIRGYITEKGILESLDRVFNQLWSGDLISSQTDSKTQKLPSESSSNEGSYNGVKFQTIYIKKEPPYDKSIDELKKWCKVFHDRNLAPPYPGGSFGNLSCRSEDGTFIITGSCIGLKCDLKNDSFVRVIDCDFEKLQIKVAGTRPPSSETLLHAAIFNMRTEINAIFHGHNVELLKNHYRRNLPETKSEKPYGTMELVQSVLELIDRYDLIIMKNHGFIVVGKTMAEAGRSVIDKLKKI